MQYTNVKLIERRDCKIWFIVVWKSTYIHLPEALIQMRVLLSLKALT